MPDSADQSSIQTFISKWQASAAAETANSQMFIAELCELLDVERPRPQGHEEDDYVFERRVDNQKTGTTNFIDLYRKGSFVWENKQGSDSASAKTTLSGERIKQKTGTAKRGTPSWSQAMTRAKNQARRYAQSLPTDHGWPPFLVVCDVGHCIDLYADFSGQGKHYAPFPDVNAFRIQLDSLHEPAVRDRLRTLWFDPQSLDPSIESARVTRELAERLGELAKRLEQKGNSPEDVAQFLMRCLFSMFAEDVELLPTDSFTDLLKGFRQNLTHLTPALTDFWELMDKGGFDRALKTSVKRFNGELFANATALELDGEEADLLIKAAEADWSHVEPAIFGTLLERALDPKERHKLGAHFTPRAYVERLVLPTIIEPLREDWQAAQALAAQALQEEAELARKGKKEDGKERLAKREEALGYLNTFHRQLCDTRVLDPACGSGNFLYVALEHMKRLEGEVLHDMEAYEGQQQLDMTGAYTVSPDQFLGIELNPRAAAIAEVVLWIGYLQWHFRTWGNADRLGEPILQRFNNIEHRDALVDTTQKGALRRTVWPDADFIIGNPPFIGNKKMREDLGDEYVEKLRSLYSEYGGSIDFVMYWWARSAQQLRSRHAQNDRDTRRFGFITTNSIKQNFNRRLIDQYMNTSRGKLSFIYALGDHHWIDSSDGASVRVAFSCIAKGEHQGVLEKVVFEAKNESLDGSRLVELDRIIGHVNSNFTIGANVGDSRKLTANRRLSFMGMKLVQSRKKDNPGFKINISEFDEQKIEEYIDAGVLKYLVNTSVLKFGYDPELVVDFYPRTESESRNAAPDLFNWVVKFVKPFRDENRNDWRREHYWLHGRPISDFRDSVRNLNYYIGTPATSKHRYFTFVSSECLPDGSIITICLASTYAIAIVSSFIHLEWAQANGGRMGVGNDLIYNPTTCFETFPFPLPTDTQREKLAALGEELDSLRKRVLAEHEQLTMTKLYNVLEAVREGQALSKKEQQIYDDGLVGTLKSIHDDIDLWTARAYGWIDDDATTFDLDEQEILQRLVDLNAARAADEKKGIIHYLRPAYQNPDGVTETQGELVKAGGSTPAVSTTKDLPKWSDLSDAERLSSLRRVIANSDVPLAVEGIAAHFKSANRKKVADLVEGLALLGVVEEVKGGWVG